MATSSLLAAEKDATCVPMVVTGKENGGEKEVRRSQRQQVELLRCQFVYSQVTQRTVFAEADDSDSSDDGKILIF